MDASAIISAIGVIITGVLGLWFKYNQKTKDKLTDLKIEQFKQEQEIKNKRRNDSSAIVFGELWSILYQMKADRVYIVQPHPLGNECLLSVYYEVKRKGIEGMRDKIQNLKMSEVAKFSADMSKNLFMYITNIDEQVDDKYAKSLLSSCGCQAAIIKRLNDSKYDWVGSIFCEFTSPMEVSEDEARTIMHEAAMNIQYLLPEYK
ncbi:hypothetical protein [Coprobacter fastidiosus]|jgi:hypothetical protein|uniref:hypothetical protein n=1 Tax=Coprobacter fastidiosus TaxID=1099853 RepID=UPI00241D72EF|nr:hypothetical protein [Coprobacter fastidiosus]